MFLLLGAASSVSLDVDGELTLGFSVIFAFSGWPSSRLSCCLLAVLEEPTLGHSSRQALGSLIRGPPGPSVLPGAREEGWGVGGAQGVRVLSAGGLGPGFRAPSVLTSPECKPPAGGASVWCVSSPEEYALVRGEGAAGLWRPRSRPGSLSDSGGTGRVGLLPRGLAEPWSRVLGMVTPCGVTVRAQMALDGAPGGCTLSCSPPAPPLALPQAQTPGSQGVDVV